MDRSDSSRTPRSRTVVEGRIKAPQTLSSEESRCIHRRRDAHHRKPVFSGLRRSVLERIYSAIRSIPSSIRCCAVLLYVLVCVCMYVHLCIHICIYMHVYVYTYMYMYIYVYMFKGVTLDV